MKSPAPVAIQQAEAEHVAGGSPFPSPFYQGGFWFGYQMPMLPPLGVAL